MDKYRPRVYKEDPSEYSSYMVVTNGLGTHSDFASSIPQRSRRVNVNSPPRNNNQNNFVARLKLH